MTTVKIHEDINVRLSNMILKRVQFTKFLGVLPDEYLTGGKTTLIVYRKRQGFQLSRIKRGSLQPGYLFLPLSSQTCKISRINEKNPAKHVKSPTSVGEKPLKITTLQIFIGQEACNQKKKKIIMIIIYLSI